MTGRRMAVLPGSHGNGPDAAVSGVAGSSPPARRTRALEPNAVAEVSYALALHTREVAGSKPAAPMRAVVGAERAQDRLHARHVVCFRAVHDASRRDASRA